MNEGNNPAAPAAAATRRHAIAGIAITLGSLAVGSRALGRLEPAKRETPKPAANQPRTSLHYEANFKASPQRIYELLLDSKQFAALTGRPAEIDPKEGGAFTMFGGLIVGRNVELIANQRIVQAWRPTHWDPGIYSIVKFEFREQGAQTRLVLDHTGFPEDQHDHLDSGWKEHYLEPLAKLLG
jgi:activator of HSP90 ATPase